MSEPATIVCAECGTARTLPAAFALCTDCLASMYWAYYDCPGCGRSWVLELAPGSVWLGDFEEFPLHAGSFVPLHELPLPGLEVTVQADGLLLRLGDETWFVAEEGAG